jgi:hypothetical protein
MPAFWTDESIGPAPPKQCTVALLFGTVLLKKLWQTEPFLELNLIFGHADLLVWLQVHYAPPSGSIAEPQGESENMKPLINAIPGIIRDSLIVFPDNHNGVHRHALPSPTLALMTICLPWINV